LLSRFYDCAGFLHPKYFGILFRNSAITLIEEFEVNTFRSFCIIVIIIIIIIFSFMQGIYTYIPETNHVLREYSVSAILSLLFMVSISLVPALALL